MERSAINLSLKSLRNKITPGVFLLLIVYGFWTILVSDFVPLESQPFPDTQS